MTSVRFISFSSGSNGNCYLVTDGCNGILIDAGVSMRRLKKELLLRGMSYDSFQAVLVTHDHLDHIRHLGSLCKHLHKPVYATETLHKALAKHSFTMDWIVGCRMTIPENSTSFIRLCSDMEQEDCPEVTNFVVPHDATQTVGYFIRWHGHRFFLMTDAGRVTPEALSFAKQADTVVFESNYDTGMLFGGPYPHELKMRICSGNGHLSNDECADAVRRFWHPGLRNLFLCHLSENNNTPSLAFEATAAALSEIPVEGGLRAKDVTNLQTLPRTSPSAIFDI